MNYEPHVVKLLPCSGHGFEVVADFLRRLEREHWRSLRGQPLWVDEVRARDLTPSPTEER